MSVIPRDGLLIAARILIVVIITLLGIAMVVVCIGAGALLFMGEDQLWQRIAVAGSPRSAYLMVLAALGLLAVTLGLAVRFFETLQQIVGSVDRGDPFDLANAARLRRMGWLGLTLQATSLAFAALERWLTPYIERIDEYGFDFGIDPAVLLLILILFILARVFERGAAMQTDLEGTV